MVQCERMQIDVTLVLDLIGMLLPIIILAIGRTDRRRALADRLFGMLLVCATLTLACDVGAWLLLGDDRAFAHDATVALETAYYAFETLFCYCWLLFADISNFDSRERLRGRAVWYVIPLCFQLAALAYNLWTGALFTVAAGNAVVPSRYFYVGRASFFIYTLGALALTLRRLFQCETAHQKQRCGIFLVFMLTPVVGALASAFSHGLSFAWMALLLLIIHLDRENKRVVERQLKSAQEAEHSASLAAELAQSRIAIMVSQIQPHFLFNALASIGALCDDDPAAASAAIDHFSFFLRRNIDALTTTVPIAFQRELEHVRDYLYIEEMRFGERLRVRYDIAFIDFLLPTLTVQPIVENAVRYGVTQRPEGGEIIIEARRDGDRAVCVVRDDGVGFDVSAPLTDGRAHVGIANVRGRLETVCRGALTIESLPGVGTVATISVPLDSNEWMGGDGA